MLPKTNFSIMLTWGHDSRFAEDRELQKRDPRRIAEMSIGDRDRIAEERNGESSS